MKKLPKWLKVLGALFLTGLVLGGIAGYSIAKHPDSKFTKTFVLPVVKPIVGFISGLEKHKNVDGTEPQFTLTSGELQSAFQKDEANAKTTYEGKVIRVNGTISSIANPTDTNIVVLLSIESDQASNVSCQMDPAFNDRLKTLAAGNTVAIKGICNGAKKDDLFNSVDILMNRCVIVK